MYGQTRPDTLAAAVTEDTMSMRADHGRELIPRPRRTPEALRAALAAVDPGRLDEMQATKDEAFAKAVEWQSLGPVRSWVLAWARDIEIARRPDLAMRHARAKSDLEHEDSVVAQEALRELSTVLDEAMKAVRGEPEGKNACGAENACGAGRSRPDGSC
ncbi:hypothetical protein GCM10010389_55040 [Streptomyces echinoruber]|uniref:Uncharacterized protein n=1 Tax=Streptomyces echinoruber TaxID=68898 RepID=A0A918RRW7_9ACTN|nr:hypothetical protein GCM10010389_55040 [Streptomyces echinoruber]